MTYTSAVKLPKAVIKKMDKRIHKIWEDDQLTYGILRIPSEESESLNFTIQENQLFVVHTDSVVLGYVFLDQDKGRYDLFDYMVVVDTSLRVKKVEVLIYRSDHGGAISNKRWLRQFEGAQPQTEFTYGKEIDAISGATLSGKSITAGVSRILDQMDVLQQHGLLKTNI